MLTAHRAGMNAEGKTYGILVAALRRPCDVFPEVCLVRPLRVCENVTGLMHSPLADEQMKSITLPPGLSPSSYLTRSCLKCDKKALRARKEGASLRC